MWYSEALALTKQLLPDRVPDFVRLYEKPKGRKDIGFENYRIEDALQGLRGRRHGEVEADKKVAVPLAEQQLAIVLSIKRCFDSSLFDIGCLSPFFARTTLTKKSIREGLFDKSGRSAVCVGLTKASL